jgi:hypothetical protein
MSIPSSHSAGSFRVLRPFRRRPHGRFLDVGASLTLSTAEAEPLLHRGVVERVGAPLTGGEFVVLRQFMSRGGILEAGATVQLTADEAARMTDAGLVERAEEPVCESRPYRVINYFELDKTEFHFGEIAFFPEDKGEKLVRDRLVEVANANGGTYRALRPFRTGTDGTFIDVGDLVRLDAPSALRFLRGGLVEPVNAEASGGGK